MIIINVTYDELCKYRKLKIELLTLEEEIEECRQLAYSVSAMKVRQDGIRVSEKIDRISQFLAKCDDLKERYLLKAQKCIECMGKITDILDTVSDSECRRVLKLFFIDGLSANLIADEMAISYKTVYRYRNKAFKELGF